MRPAALRRRRCPTSRAAQGIDSSQAQGHITDLPVRSRFAGEDMCVFQGK